MVEKQRLKLNKSLYICPFINRVMLDCISRNQIHRVKKIQLIGFVGSIRERNADIKPIIQQLYKGTPFTFVQPPGKKMTTSYNIQNALRNV
ncbi:hypothetical protein DPMN_014754 [Dreissena polymorpha]|uniref:Uncharacterized protein n=1 Tax=Dreissena polymorpha TaxID=45954 RepID=A0A9D4S305_DREPO|nr:hypothetical protein DPMN_014754 [Dreissena polymorpha]